MTGILALWALAGAIPLTVAGSIALAGLLPPTATRRVRGALTSWAPLAVAPTAALALVSGDRPLRADWLLLGTTMRFDAVAVSLVLLACALYAAALASVRQAPIERASALSGVLLVCFVANAGVFAAADAVTFYLCFAVMSFVAYALVVHDRSAKSRRAGRIYLVLTVLGESAVLAALLLIADAGGLALVDAPAAVAQSAHRDLIVLLLLLGFGVKAGAVPLHVWLPLAHPAAPAPASAVLSGSMITAGLVGWVRFLPLGEEAWIGWGGVFLALALLGAFAAVPLGVLQKDPKVILAYSSISQMGLLMALVGAALTLPALAPACLTAATVYAVQHGVVKGALFLGVPLWLSAGRARRAVLTIGLGAAALSLAGAALTPGFVAKYAVKDAVGEVRLAPVGVPLELVLTLVGVGSTVLLLRAGAVLLPRQRAYEPSTAPFLAWLALLGAAFPLTALGPLARAADLPLVPADPSAWWSAVWPILVGVALAGLLREAGRRGLLPEWAAHPDGRAVPPGDAVVWEEAAARRLLAGTRRAESGAARVWRAVTGRVAGIRSPLPALGCAQSFLGEWAVTGAATIGVLVIALAMSMGGAGW